jgi:hypothetical protein
VRIDCWHKSWLLASLAILGGAALVYVLARPAASRGSMGGTSIGLVFGTVGFAFMIFAALLGARKKVPVWRLGRAQTWMRGHLWLGLLSLPLILLHSGIRYGHGLTALLMTLLIVVIASGIFGAALQHYLPSVITREVTMETIYEEIDHVRAQLREEAEQLVAAASKQSAAAVAAGAGSTVTEIAVSEDVAAPLRSFFEQQLAPFLADPGARGRALANAALANSAFAQLRMLVPPALHETIGDLENICDEQRQLVRQAQLHRWLHGWLLLHIPLSFALLVLGAVHAVMALRY